MLRPLAIVASLIALGSSAFAQDLSGTWTVSGQTGTVTLVLRVDAQGNVTGTLSGGGANYQIQGQLQEGALVGTASGGGMQSYVEAMAQGNQLSMVMADLGPDGVPNTAAAQQILFTRAGGAPAAQAPAPRAGGLVGGALGATTGGQAPADPFVGTFSNGAITLVLHKSGGAYTGAFQSSGQQAPLQAQAGGGGITGTIQDTDGTTYMFQANVQGATLTLVINGQQMVLQRTAGGGSATASAAAPQPGAAGGPGSVGSTPQDLQLAQLLLTTNWCAFSYHSGVSSTEKVSFGRNGVVSTNSGGENYQSGSAGTFYSASQGGDQLYWRIQGGQALLSRDGATWAPLPMQVELNSAGNPIIKANGKEYMRCN